MSSPSFLLIRSRLRSSSSSAAAAAARSTQRSSWRRKRPLTANNSNCYSYCSRQQQYFFSSLQSPGGDNAFHHQQQKNTRNNDDDNNNKRQLLLLIQHQKQQQQQQYVHHQQPKEALSWTTLLLKQQQQQQQKIRSNRRSTFFSSFPPPNSNHHHALLELSPSSLSSSWSSSLLQQRPLATVIRQPSSLHRNCYPNQLVFFSTNSTNSNDDDNNNNIEEEDQSDEYKKQQKQQRATAAARARLAVGPTKVPTPPSAPPDPSGPFTQLKTPRNIAAKVIEVAASLFKTILVAMARFPGILWYYMINADQRKQRVAEIKKTIREEVNHYWVGTKLLYGDVITARSLLAKTLQGSALTRRERKQLLRTVSDLFRLVPFSMFVLIPLMEFALPLALKLFPNLLPSTYQESLKVEESMKKELQSRIAMAQFFQDTLEELAKEQKRKASKRKEELEQAGVIDPNSEGECGLEKQEASANSMLEFLEQARNGEMIPPDAIIKYANYFQDDLTLDNMPRMQLINMCKYMAIPPYGSESFLRFQLRHRIRTLKEDDQRILWEGIDSLTKMELREACQERGMRSTGLSKDAYKRALQQWLDLSVHKDVPISLLIMSRIFFLREEMLELKPDDGSTSLTGLVDAISGLDKEVLNEVILEVATSQEKKSDPDIRKIKLEVLNEQNELIRQEQEARDAAAKKKEEKEAAEKDKDVASLELPKAPADAQDNMAFDATISTGDGPIVIGETPEKSQDTEGEDEEIHDLSPDEMDAISQLVSEDPVSKERAELERIKAAMKAESSDQNDASEISVEDEPLIGKDEKVFTDESDTVSSFSHSSLVEEKGKPEDRVNNERLESKTVPETGKSTEGLDAAEGPIADEELVVDPIVERLQKRIESMVDKIEVQLSDVQVKIGDKLHYLDKDKDGILSREEIAHVIHQVLQREITFDEAMETAEAMDSNNDGVVTVDELIKWIDEHKLVKFVEEDRDADMDRIIESQSVEQQKEDPSQAPGKFEQST